MCVFEFCMLSFGLSYGSSNYACCPLDSPRGMALEAQASASALVTYHFPRTRVRERSAGGAPRLSGGNELLRRLLGGGRARALAGCGDMPTGSAGAVASSFCVEVSAGSRAAANNPLTCCFKAESNACTMLDSSACESSPSLSWSQMRSSLWASFALMPPWVHSSRADSLRFPSMSSVSKRAFKSSRSKRSSNATGRRPLAGSMPMLPLDCLVWHMDALFCRRRARQTWCA
mmetsp:Transcript_122548/g.291294  ORF Transcript_122548/g.291294 Transcript_122548/m.291294 type:complete len:231 (-) Transcript_122548:1183-1875(-)